MVVAVLPHQLQLGEERRIESVYELLVEAAVFRLAHHHSGPRLAGLLEKAKTPPLLLELHTAPEELLKVVPQFRDAPLVHPE